MHCGWLDESEWTESTLPEMLSHANGYAVPIKRMGVCPGWLLRQPAIAEAKMAGFAMEKGQLSVVFPGNENAIVEAAMLMVAAWAEFEQHAVKHNT